MSAVDGSAFVETMGASVVGIVVLMAVTYGARKVFGHHSVIDVAWGTGFVVVAAIASVVGGGSSSRRVLELVLTAVWGLRLAGHIGERQFTTREEDPRYAKMLSKVKGNKELWALGHIYALQAGLIFFVSLTLQLNANMHRGLNVLSYVGVVIWVVGLFFEAVGDRQLREFRNDPAKKGQVIDTGLWKYTRHPNYFGDATVWVGLFVVAVSGSAIGLAALPCVATMVWFLAYGSGKPILERQMMRTKPGYADYVKRTSGFVPLPPRKVTASEPAAAGV